ncbi:nucleotidyltransferase domain-containing protein [Bacteroides fragilis]|nr:nucleotidyltransferase domain-containing protein [Bacteroides fragilis]
MFGLSDIVINDLKGVFKQYPNIEEVRIFGSRAKGNYSEGSDIDLALIGEGLTFNTIMDINIKIEDLELLYKVDILNYREKRGTPIGDHIDRVGQLFYKKRYGRQINQYNY